jgi:hypothetical protein
MKMTYEQMINEALWLNNNNPVTTKGYTDRWNALEDCVKALMTVQFMSLLDVCENVNATNVFLAMRDDTA